MQTYPPGTRIGQYEIASRPMMGGMGVVYFALGHGNDGRPVALKTFRPELLADRAARDRFLREGTAWVELGSHPNIVRCYSVEYYDPIVLLVLELIAKEQNMPDASLRSWLIPGHPLPLEQALPFALQIARGMQYATEKIPGFVHRDLKPENILVGADKLPGTNINRLRVTDFGLVKTIAGGDIPAKAGDEGELKPNRVQFTHGVGTPLYMAPEQWKGEPVGIFTDVYAFGCILYEMLAGHYAATGKTITELQIAHCEGRLRPIQASLPQEIAALATKCLALNPSHRYDAWDEIMNDLDHVYNRYSGRFTPQPTAQNESKHEERMQVGWSYTEIGLAYQDIGKVEVAAGYFEKALKIARETRDRHGEGSILLNLGIAHLNLGDAREAIQFYQQALVIAREIGDRRSESDILDNLGVAHLHLGDAREAIQFYQQALVIAREIGDRRSESNALGNLGIAYRNLGDARKAVQFYQQALAIEHEIGDQRAEAGDLVNLGVAYAVLGDVRRAIQFYQQALMIVRAIGDRRFEGNALDNLGIAYSNLGDARKAIELHEQALVIAREIGNRQGVDNTLGNLGNAYLRLGDTRKAIEFYEKQLMIAREIGDRRGEGTALENMGRVYRMIGNIEEARSLWQGALAIEQAIGDARAVWIQQWLRDLDEGTEEEKDNAMSLQDFVHGTIQAARTHDSQTPQYFEVASKMARDANSPAELQELGKVLQRILTGVKNPDLSGLPEELANLIREELEK